MGWSVSLTQIEADESRDDACGRGQDDHELMEGNVGLGKVRCVVL